MGEGGGRGGWSGGEKEANCMELTIFFKRKLYTNNFRLNLYDVI